MEKLLTLLSDLCVIVFDLFLYEKMTTLRNNDAKTRTILTAGCTAIVTFYVLAVNVFSWTVAISAFVCMTIPSLALFWSLCKYRDARFFLTFCFVDTVSLIVGFIARYIGLMLGNVGSIVSIVVMLVAFIIIYKVSKPYIKRYREALEIIDRGWKRITLSAALIYITLIVIAAYPEPLKDRPEYNLPYLVVCLMVLSFYAVFFANMTMTRRVYEQSKQLQEQQKWFAMAYVDALTEIPNRMAYMEKIHELERTKDSTTSVAITVMDLDHFKNINDTCGHSTGDDVLKWTAKHLSGIFSDENSAVYRIGGDEFAAITVGKKEDELKVKLKALEEFRHSDVPCCSISYGYSFVDSSEDNSVAKAFARADAMMYSNKAT